MSKAYVDPAELRRFAADLNRFNNDLTGLLGSLHGRLRGLESSWRDQEQKKFSDGFEQTLKVVSKFMEDSKVHVSVLNKKAAAVEDYLKVK